MIWHVVFAAAAGCALSCAGARGAPDPMDAGPSRPTAEPVWVHGECSSFWASDATPRICAVGSASGSGSGAALRQQAARRAEVQLVQAVRPALASVISDFASSRHGHATFGKPADPALVAEVTERVASGCGRAARVTSLWNTGPQRVHLLLAITPAECRAAVEQMRFLGDDLRAKIIHSDLKGF